MARRRGRPRRSETIARELATGALLTEAHVSVYVLRALIVETDVLITRGEPQGVRAAEHCVEIADQLGELRAEAYMRRASGCRLAGRYQDAFQALDFAESIGGDAVRGDVLRRRACVHNDLGEYDEALMLSSEAVRITKGKEHAIALATLALVHSLRQEFATALPYYETALGFSGLAEYQLEPLLTNYTLALAKLPDKAQQALKQYEDVRKRLGDEDKLPRAKCWWGIGLSHKMLGDKVEAWRSMSFAMRSLEALGLGREIALLVADMAEVSAAVTAVRVLASEVSEKMTEPVLIAPLQVLARVRQADLPQAVAALREAAHSPAEPTAASHAPEHGSQRLSSPKVIEIPETCERCRKRPPAVLVIQDDTCTALCRECA